MIKKIEHKVDYQGARRNRYPDIGEQLGDMWKVLESLALVNPELATALKSCPSFQQIKQVKERVKKPYS